ncbi:uncharacterized protein LOC124953272 isoform X2 [Vespa velutina]|uniref:uncharacterized protein LOC124953272 isoform X2 n=1 Tax=Vespa velutina TaxID=202808 RepID=UPI001FB3898F|nr:uncharacterized protein LOC124953272 isoform X2 [Vespa velutina]
MASRSERFVEQHFLLSNRLVQFILGLRSNQNSRNQLFVVSAITVYILPIIVYELYQLLTMDFNLTTTVIELRKIVAFLIMISAYSTTYFQFVTVRLLLFRIKYDCEHMSDEMELFIVEKYTKKTKTYAYAVID